MAIREEWIRYGESRGWFAVPAKASTPLPAVIVIQEMFGVNAHIRDVTRRIAAAGYAALAPDLFWSGGARPPPITEERIGEALAFGGRLPPGGLFDPKVRDAELSKVPDDQRLRIVETMGELRSQASPDRVPALVAPLESAFHHLRAERPETRGQPAACVGFCMGGGLSALLACEEPELAGAAVYYGVTPPVDRIAKIACPVIAFYGGLDQRVNAGIPAFEQAMRSGNKSYERHVYEGAGHSFFNDDGPYDVKAARDSWARLMGFFRKVLTG